MKQYHDLPEVSFPHVRVERGTRVLYRDQFTKVHAYAPGDGDLSFVAQDTRTTKAISPHPTQAEAEAICRDGWEIYMNGPYPRARKTGITNAVPTEQGVQFEASPESEEGA